RSGAQESVFSGAHSLRRHVLHLAGRPIVTCCLAAIDDARIQRVGSDVAVLFDSHRPPLAAGNLSIVAPAGDPGRAAFLLTAVDPVRKLVVRHDMVKLNGGLVVPGAPRLASVYGHRS